MNERKLPENVVATAEVETSELRDGEGRLRLTRRQLGRASGGRALGTSLCTLHPGEASWPLHVHAVNEEAIYVLGGTPTLRLASVSTREVREVPLVAGDYASFPTGPDHAHQLVNRSDEPAEYLVISTMHPHEVGVYMSEDPEVPDKVGVFAGAPPGGDKRGRWLTSFFRADDTLGYWESTKR